MLSYFVRVFTLGVPPDAPIRSITSVPGVLLIVALHLWALMGAWIEAWGLIGMSVAGLLMVWSFLLKGEGMLPSGRSRRLGAALFPATLAILIYTAFTAYRPADCAVLSPGIFLLIWPLSVVLVGVGGATIASLGAREGWQQPEMAKEGLIGLAVVSFGLSILLAGSWTCLPVPGLLILHALCLVVATLAIVRTRPQSVLSAGLFSQQDLHPS